MPGLTHKATPVGLCVLLLTGTFSHETQTRPRGATSFRWMGADGPLSFEENRSQFEGPARFVAHGQGFTLSLQPGEAVMKLGRKGPGDPPVAVRMALAGGRARTPILGRDELPGRSHYLRGSDPAGWVRDVPSYAQVEYEEVYPGIDLVFRGDGKHLEYDFVVAPGADPRQIRLVFGGIKRARLDAGGDLILETRAGAVRQRQPRLYQEAGGGRREVAGGFALRGRSEVGFSVGPYDATRPLVIDPEVVYSTLDGGARGYQGIQDVAVDAEGNAYVAGYYPWDGDRGLPDMFVTKVSPTGVRLSRTTIGGWWADVPAAVALDALGNIYLTGYTDSTRCCRPFAVVNALQPDNAGGRDAFVTKLGPTGRTILYSTFLGGAGDDRGTDIEVDARGRIHVAGKTSSTNFPTASPWQAALAGGTDAFVTVFEADGSALVFSTYLGGSGNESVARMALSERDTVIAGTTSSPDFPARGSALQPAFGGGPSDAFLAILSPGGGVQDATFLGGSGKDDAFGVALDGAGFIYMTGGTDSSDFPTASPLQPALSFPPDADAFVAKVEPKLDSLVYSTYLGVRGAVTCSSFPSDAPCGGVAVDTGGTAYVTAQGVFVIKVDAAGKSRLYTCNGFGGHAIAVRSGAQAPEIFMAGRTGSFLFPTFNAYDPFHRWYETEEGWLAKLADVPNPGAAFEENDPRITYSGAWETDVSPEHSGGTALRSAETGAKATITFTGTGIQVIGRRDPSAGVVKVSQNWDVNFQTSYLDTYASPAEARSLLFSFSGLSQGTHTVTLEVAGTHNSRSTGDGVWIDGINVLGAPAP